MTPDDVIATRRSWEGWNWAEDLPPATIYATPDWLAYVSAMAATIPAESEMEFPTEEDCRWAWPDGVTIVFGHPVTVNHVITSHHESGGIVFDEPHVDAQTIIGLGITPLITIGSRLPDGTPVYEAPGRPHMIPARGVTYVGQDLNDVVSGRLIFGQVWKASLDTVSGSQRFLQALVVALGHRLSSYSSPSGPRAMLRRIDRELPGLRVIDLAAGASVEDRGGSVEWSRRWMVRGHPRNQPYGPGRSKRKWIWVDPYVKGPADKPFDDRPTLWRATP